MQHNEQKRSDAQEAGKRLVARHLREDPFASAFKATRLPMISTDPSHEDSPIIFCNRTLEDWRAISRERLGHVIVVFSRRGSSGESAACIRETIAAGSDVFHSALTTRPKLVASFVENQAEHIGAEIEKLIERHRCKIDVTPAVETPRRRMVFESTYR
ncbi:hypothetical protein [Rhizobium sp. 2MFCol3.1]|uniref:hypothetical protein n=1 Tax=Rhizobium sp. 2MFCol3.1 TaxID=1246459 RepID=UPI0018CBA32D|nr:hypothetical protein [Rhizobium sp. 2MFCol3.1]